MIMEYTLVSSKDEKEFIGKVNEMIENGWETEGGVTITSDGTFYQSMILFEDENSENSDVERVKPVLEVLEDDSVEEEEDEDDEVIEDDNEEEDEVNDED